MQTSEPKLRMCYGSLVPRPHLLAEKSGLVEKAQIFGPERAQWNVMTSPSKSYNDSYCDLYLQI